MRRELMTPQDTSDHCSEDPLPTRSSLLGRLKDWEDQDSWRAFFDTYWRLIYNFSIRSGLTHEEAQEAVQETVVAVAKSISRFQYDPKGLITVADDFDQPLPDLEPYME